MAWSASGCGNGVECSAEACANPVHITATVPPITDTWTVTVCLNTFCGDGQLTSSQPETNVGPNLAGVSVQPQDGSNSVLTVYLRVPDPKDGDHYSLKVVDSSGGVIVEGDRTVTYSTYQLDECTTCKKADFTIP